MQLTSDQSFQAILDEAWKSEHADAMECRKCEDLIVRVCLLWDQDRQFFASVVPGSLERTEARAIAATLRLAEQAMTQTVGRATASVAKGYTVEGLNRLLACLSEVRALIVLPIARRMAERDAEGRSADQLASLLAHRVRFQDGRPVIDAETAAAFPCPFDPETSF